MAMGEGGPELVKQLLSQTYDINMPGVVGVYLKGAPVKGVGPQDVALALIGAVFAIVSYSITAGVVIYLIIDAIRQRRNPSLVYVSDVKEKP